MRTLFANAKLVDPAKGTVHPGQLLVGDGRILDVLPPSATVVAPQVVDCAERHLAPGLVDMGVTLHEPGLSPDQSIELTAKSAAAGGVTTIITPGGARVASLETLARRAQSAAVRVHTLAVVSEDDADAKDLAAMMAAGAVGFTTDGVAFRSGRVFERVLAQTAALGAVLVGHPQDPEQSQGAVATAGSFASLKGLPSVDATAERRALERDLALAASSHAAYHADQVTTAEACAELEQAKTKSGQVSAGTSIHHLSFNEFDIAPFRSAFKFTPPLRSEQDRRAIVDALSQGLIDTVSSFHTPVAAHGKAQPFEDALPGAVGLETLLPASLRLYHAGDIALPDLMAKLSLNPARRFGLDTGRLSKGAPADLMLFDPDAPLVLNPNALVSPSKNTPFAGARLQGRVIGTWVGGSRVYGHDA